MLQSIAAGGDNQSIRSAAIDQGPVDQSQMRGKLRVDSSACVCIAMIPAIANESVT
jgi:hypothetical protein